MIYKTAIDIKAELKRVFDQTNHDEREAYKGILQRVRKLKKDKSRKPRPNDCIPIEDLDMCKPTVDLPINPTGTDKNSFISAFCEKAKAMIERKKFNFKPKKEYSRIAGYLVGRYPDLKMGKDGTVCLLV